MVIKQQTKGDAQSQHKRIQFVALRPANQSGHTAQCAQTCTLISESSCPREHKQTHGSSAGGRSSGLPFAQPAGAGAAAAHPFRLNHPNMTTADIIFGQQVQCVRRKQNKKRWPAPGQNHSRAGGTEAERFADQSIAGDFVAFRSGARIPVSERAARESDFCPLAALAPLGSRPKVSQTPSCTGARASTWIINQALVCTRLEPTTTTTPRSDGPRVRQRHLRVAPNRRPTDRSSLR